MKKLWILLPFLCFFLLLQFLHLQNIKKDLKIKTIENQEQKQELLKNENVFKAITNQKKIITNINASDIDKRIAWLQFASTKKRNNNKQ